MGKSDNRYYPSNLRRMVLWKDLAAKAQPFADQD
jgi:hypothetical protein